MCAVISLRIRVVDAARTIIARTISALIGGSAATTASTAASSARSSLHNPHPL